MRNFCEPCAGNGVTDDDNGPIRFDTLSHAVEGTAAGWGAETP